MALMSLGDLAQSFLLRRQNVALRAEQQRQSQEVATGRAADTARHLSGDLGPLAATEVSLARLGAYATTTAEVAGRAQAMQAILVQVDALTGMHAGRLVSATDSGGAAAVSESRAVLDSVVAALNMRAAGQTVLAGMVVDGPALLATESWFPALQTATAGAGTAAELEAAVAAWFAAPTGFSAAAWRGEGEPSAAEVATGERVGLTATAISPAVIQTLQALALAAVLDGSSVGGSATVRTSVLHRAGEQLLSSQSARAELAAEIGAAEARIAQAQARNAAETSALGIARSGLLAVDPYEAAVRLEATQGQLDALYTVTTRISRLSLVEYLR